MKRSNLWNGNWALVMEKRLQRSKTKEVCRADLEAPAQTSLRLTSWENLPYRKAVGWHLPAAAPVGSTMAFDPSHTPPGQTQAATEYGRGARATHFCPGKHSFLGSVPSPCPFLDAKPTLQSEGFLWLLPHPLPISGITPNKLLAPLTWSWRLCPTGPDWPTKQVASFHKWHKVA